MLQNFTAWFLTAKPGKNWQENYRPVENVEDRERKGWETKRDTKTPRRDNKNEHQKHRISRPYRNKNQPKNVSTPHIWSDMSFQDPWCTRRGVLTRFPGLLQTALHTGSSILPVQVLPSRPDDHSHLTILHQRSLLLLQFIASQSVLFHSCMLSISGQSS